MKTLFISRHHINELNISGFGYAKEKSDTFWRTGSRNQYIVHYVLSGKGYYNGNPVCENQGFIIEPQISAEYHYDDDCPWEYFWFTATGPLTIEICKDHIRADENRIFDYDFRSSMQYMVNKLFLGINEKSAASISEDTALSVFFKILSFHERIEDDKTNIYVDNAKKYIELNFHRPITVCELAEIQSISDRYLYNLFIKHEGVSPKQYLNECRLRVAKNLLETTKLSITEIAESVGYNDVLAFSKFFSSHIGKSPTDFKKKK